MSRKTSRMGTLVPVWSGDRTSVCVPGPSCGASMIPAAISALVTPSVPLARPRASKAAVRTSSV